MNDNCLPNRANAYTQVNTVMTSVRNDPQNSLIMFNPPADANNECEYRGRKLPLSTWLQLAAVEGGDQDDPLSSCKNLACAKAVMAYTGCYDAQFRTAVTQQCAISRAALTGGTIIVNFPQHDEFTDTRPHGVKRSPMNFGYNKHYY